MSTDTLEERLEQTYDVDIDAEIAKLETPLPEITEPAQEHVAPARFVVDSDDKANWALRKLAKLARWATEDMELAQQEIDRITAWLEERQRQLSREASYFEGLLAEYHRGILATDPKRKTIKLPAGQLTARDAAANVHVEDPEAFVKWCKDNKRPDLLRTKVEVDRAALKQTVLKDGEAIPGVEVVAGETQFKAKPEEAK